VCGPGLARAADIQSARGSSPRPGLPLAIADLDGDHQPDFATVEARRSNSPTTADYWIQVRFSASERRSIHLVAPKGGLVIEARDVNGDHAVDLVLFTARLRRPVAILLNDRHGGFSKIFHGIRRARDELE
jgi:hypothetical protein